MAIMTDAIGKADATAKVKEKGDSWQKRSAAKKRAAALKVIGLLNADQKKTVAVEIELLTKEPGTGAAAFGGTPVINKIFGDELKAGTKISFLDVAKKTKKGYQEIKQYIKKWAEKGTIVKYDEKTEMYVLEKVGQ